MTRVLISERMKQENQRRCCDNGSSGQSDDIVGFENIRPPANDYRQPLELESQETDFPLETSEGLHPCLDFTLLLYILDF